MLDSLSLVGEVGANLGLDLLVGPHVEVVCSSSLLLHPLLPLDMTGKVSEDRVSAVSTLHRAKMGYVQATLGLDPLSSARGLRWPLAYPTLWYLNGR